MNLKDDGIQIFPSVFTKEEVEELREAAHRCLEKTNPQYHHRYIENSPAGTPAIAFWPSLVDPVVEKFSTDPRFIKIVQGILGDDIRRLNNQFYYRYPNDGDTFNWHTDMRFRKGEKDSIREDYLQTAIICDDWTEDNGAVEYIRGSHKEDFEERKSLRGKEDDLKGTKVFPKAGDVAVWSVAIVHASSENVTDKPRSYLMNGLARAQSSTRWPFLLKDGEVQELDPTLIP